MVIVEVELYVRPLALLSDLTAGWECIQLDR
jgi:hypothetical protein